MSNFQHCYYSFWMNYLIISKNIKLRLVETSDAAFIIDLRINNGTYLSYISRNIDKQIEWINYYKKRENLNIDFYFVIEDNNLNKLGTIRIYNINYVESQFTFGSFIIMNSEKKSKYTALEAINEIFNYAFDTLNLNICVFDCRKNNDKANKFYQKYQADLIDENEINYFYKLSKKKFLRNFLKFKSVYS